MSAAETLTMNDKTVGKPSPATVEPAPPGTDDLPSQGLLSFYDNLRDRVVEAAENRDSRFGPQLTEALLLVPDVVMLMLRLSLDREVPRSARVLLGGALAYFVLPLDLWPEGIVGPVGYTDDLVLAVAVLAQAFDRELEPFAAQYWSGREPVRRVLQDVLHASESLLGSNLYSRLQRLLKRRGVDLEIAEA